jgi:soluble lytic murein transglycosylase-like protein
MPPDPVTPPPISRKISAHQLTSQRVPPPLPVSWLAAIAIAAVGIGFLTLMIFGILGLLGLLTGISSARPEARKTPILLVAPGIGAATADRDAALPESSEIQEFVAAPVVVATPLAAETRGEAAPQPAEAIPPPSTFRDLFQEVGDAYGIDWRLLAALAFHESRLNPAAVGRDGDMGLMQILPRTWGEFAPPVAASDPFDPRSNVEVAASYLLYLQDYLDRLGHGEIYWVLAAYNWGPDNVRKLLARGGAWEETPERTRRYVADILYSAFGVRFED